MSNQQSERTRAPSSILSQTTVRQAMHPGVLACAPGTSLPAVAAMMSTHGIHCVAVMGVGETEAGEELTWRFVTPADLFGTALAGDDVATAAAMAHEVIETIEPEASLVEAATELLDTSATHLLVVDAHDQRPVGVLSTQDIVSALARA